MSLAQLQEQLTWANFQFAVQQSDVKLAEWSVKAGLEKPVTSLLLAQAFAIFLVSSILVKIVMSFINHRKLELQLANIPTVPHSFPFQHLLQLLQRPPWDVLCDWVTKYGTMLRFHFVNTYVVVADVDVVKHIMYTNVHNYQKDLKTTYKPFLAVLGTGVVTAHGDLWRQERSIVANAFRLEILGFASRVSYAAAERLMKRLEPLRGTSEPVIMAEELRRLTLQVIGEAVLSLPPEESDRVFPELYFPIVKEANKLTWYPWRRFLPLPGTFAYHSCTKRLNAYMTNLVRTRWAKRQTSKPKSTIGAGGNKADFEMEGDILDRVLESITPDRWNDETVRQLRDECKTFILAGHETSSMMLCWAVYELMKNPRCLAKVREEAAQVFTKNGVPNFDDFKKLNYTYNVLKETLRKYALVPVVTREVVEDDQVGDYFFPKGSFIAILIKSIHHQKALWTDPEVFRPERFEEKLGHQFQFLPFIEGPRNCLGQHFALLESKIILSMLVSRFTFEPAPGNTGTPHPYEIPVGPEDNMRLLVK